MINPRSRNKSRKIPFPLELLEIPQIERLKGNQFGVFMRLVFSFWKTGIPIPTGDYDRACLVQIDIATMQRYRDPINTCLVLAMPAIESYLSYMHSLRKRQIASGKRIANMTSARKRLQKIEQKIKLTDQGLTHENLVPVPKNPYENQYNKEHIDMPAYVAAKQAKASKTPAKSFKD